MTEVNKVVRIKQLIIQIKKADDAYYGEDAPIMTDREYDALMDELVQLEKETKIIFANSPTKRVSGRNRDDFQKITHTKPMLSAQKTKDINELYEFTGDKDVVLSWKMDGLTLVLRYEDGKFRQAITRGEEGLVGEDVTHTVRFIGNIPKTVNIKEPFEVRGEGVISFASFGALTRNQEGSHPRNVAAGAVRSIVPDKSKLEHLYFYAFELIMPDDKTKTKMQQLSFLSENGFDVVGHKLVKGNCGEQMFKEVVGDFKPGDFAFPADGIIAEFNNLAYGRSLGATGHHERRMMALKWSDGLYETTFRGVDLSVTRTGQINIVAEFDPVNIDGTIVKRADIHSLSEFEKLKLGIGDTIRVYKANMVIPQIAENATQSGIFEIPGRCPCCGSQLTVRMSSNGSKNLYCSNEYCMAMNARKIAHFCDKDAMGISGMSMPVIENLLAYGVLTDYASLYRLESKSEKILDIPGIGEQGFRNLCDAVDKSRCCHLCQFLAGVGIPLMSRNAAQAIDEYFNGSWDEFEKAIKGNFIFSHIAGINDALNRNIYRWYSNEQEEALWRDVLKEITFIGHAKKIGTAGNPFTNANVVITGNVNGMNRKDANDLLTALGAFVSEQITKDTHYLIIGANPDTLQLATALQNNVKIITEGHFSSMLAGSSA